MHGLFNWFLTVTGSNNTSGVWYGFFSGFGSDLGEIAIIGGVYSLYKKHNCHINGCWRIAKYPVEGTPYIVCKKHHPVVPENITVKHVHGLYNRSNK